MKSIDGQTHTLLQWEYHSTKTYADPFNEIVLDVHLTAPSGKAYTLPTFWMGEQRWAVRFMPEETGLHKLITQCSDTKNSALHVVEDEIFVTQGEKVPPRQLKVSEDKTHLVTKDDTPFFWLSDTWWMALSARLSYPKDFHRLTSYRKDQGFNTIMLVAGLFPDMDSFDDRGSNEAGFPWEDDYRCINPHYFDKADERITHLVQEGFTPVILGAWGYYLQHLGEKKMKQHWRNIIARWGSYPVVWCIAGEASMPYYLSKNRTKDTHILKEGWSDIGQYIKDIDPFKRLLTIHPTEVGREQVTCDNILDINLLQASHHGYGSVTNSIKLITEEKDKTPQMPLIMSEVNYEGILLDTHAAVQRLTFWSAILSGSKGFGYGANGIWQVNTLTKPFGESPHGGTWGNTPWQEALLLKGALHIAIAKKVLEAYPWWDLKSQQECIIPAQEYLDPKSVRIAGIGAQLRIAYFYIPVYPWEKPNFSFTYLDPTTSYNGYFLNPRDGSKTTIPTIDITSDGCWKIPNFPSFEDWVIIIESNSNTTSPKPSRLKSIIYYVNSKKSKIKKWILRKV